MKKLRNVLALILAFTMLLPYVTALASAAEADPIVNLYIEAESAGGTAQNTASAAPKANVNYHTSGIISVSAGDQITVGPILKDQSWFLMGYDADGNKVDAAYRITPAACTAVEAICGNAMIYTYTVPDGVESIRVTTSQMFFDSMLITRNRVFTKTEYLAFMDASGINVDYLRPANSAETLVNLFPVSEDTVMGKVNEGFATEDSTYRSTDLFEVTPGDVIYYAAALKEQGYHISIVDANGNGYNVTPDLTILYEDLGRGYATYAYRVRPNTQTLSVVLNRSCYDDGITLVTKNQPFTGDTYRKAFHIDLNKSAVNTASPLYGLKGLFMGDSISYGYSDVLSYLEDPTLGKAWAGRIAAATGLLSTNASVAGATVAKSDNWVFDQYASYTEKEFDLIVMHGGANDAKFGTAVGAPLATDASEAELEAATDTYVGGLQWLFHTVKRTNPDATLFFIANHRLDGSKVAGRRDMSAYFDAAKELCEIYGVHFIDLYNNDELNEKLETSTTKYLPDTTHLINAGYDILTPYILRELESVMRDNSAVLFEENFNDVTDKLSFSVGENTSGATDGWYYDKPEASTGSSYIENGKLYMSGTAYDKLYYSPGSSWFNYTLEADFCYASGNNSKGWGGMLYNVQSSQRFQKVSISNGLAAANGWEGSTWVNNDKTVNQLSLATSVTSPILSGTPIRMKVVAYNNQASFYYAYIDENGALQGDYIHLLTIDNIPDADQTGTIGFMTSNSRVGSFWVDNIKCYANVFTEDFSYADTELTGNTTHEDMGLEYIKTSVSGVAKIEDGRLYMSRGDSPSAKSALFDAVYFTAGKNWTNYLYEADYTYHFDEAQAWSGLAYRSTDMQNFQKAALTPFYQPATYPNGAGVMNGQLNGAFHNNKAGHTIVSLEGNHVELNKAFRLRVVAVDSTAQLYVAYYGANGVLGAWSLVMEINDTFADIHASGTFGLIIGGARTGYKTAVSIDNVVVRCATEDDFIQGLLYEEDFSYDDTALNANEENVELGLNYIKNSNNGVAEIKDGMLHMSRGDSDSSRVLRTDAVYFTAGEKWHNYSVEADYIYLIKESNAWSGLAYRSNDAANFQKAALTPYLSSYPNGVAVMNGQLNGSWYKNDTAITFSEFDASKVELGKPVRLRVVVVENTAQLFVAFYDESGNLGNFTFVMEINDRFAREHANGTVGLVIGASRTNYKTDICMDNVVVRRASKNDLYVVPDYTTQVYVPESGIVNPPVVVQALTDALPFATGERPAVLLLNVDADMNVLGSNGNSITTVSQLIDTYRTSLLPAFIVDSEAEADALAALIEKEKLTEGYVVADAENATLVHRVRTANTTTQKITGALIFDDLNTPASREEARYLTVESMSFVVISRTALSEETARYFNTRQIAAWGTATNEAGVYQGIANGYHGIVSTDPAMIYDVYESITETTVSGKPIIISHRGENKQDAATRHPENTVVAIKAAKEIYNADGVEIDLKMTKDGYLVLMHDADVDRTADGTGNVADLTLAEIKAMNVDYLAGYSEKIPTFEEILEVISKTDIVLYCHIATVTDEILASVSYLVDQYDCRDKVVLFLNHANRTTYNANNTAVCSSTAYGFTDFPVALDGMMYVLGGDKYIIKNLTDVNTAFSVMRDTALPYNYQPFFYPYSKSATNAALWDNEEFYYQMSARGIVNSHSVTNGQESLDFHLLTGTGTVGILTDGTHLTDDYHYAIDAKNEALTLGDALNTTQTLLLNKGTASADCGVLILEGNALQVEGDAYTAASLGTVTLVYYADRTVSGGTTYRIYSAPVTVTVTEPQKAVFTGAALNLGADLSMLYYVRVNDASILDGGAPAVLFTIGGKSVTVSEYATVDGEYVFTLDGIAPQQIGDSIDASFLVGDEIIATHTGYSIKKNCQNLLSKSAAALGISEEKHAELKTLISDLLLYGEAAQGYVDYNTDAPITQGVEGLTPSDKAPSASDALTLVGNTDKALCFKSATVHFNTTNAIRVKIVATAEDAILTVDGVAYTLSDLARNADGSYTFTLDDVFATAFDDVHTFTLSRGGETVATLTYSINAYAYAMSTSSNAEMQELALTLYRYGASASAYGAIS